MRTFVILSCILILLTLNSCGVSRVYPSGTYASIHNYVAKPEYHGENDAAFYLGATVSTGQNKHFDGSGKDSKFLVSLNAHRSITRKHINAYYGAGFGIGSYTFKSGLQDFISAGDREAFYGISARAGMNFTLPGDNWDLRLLGFNVRYIYEFGPYQNRLADLANILPEELDVLIVNEKSMFAPYLNSEAVYKIDPDNALGLEVFYGSVVIDGKSRKTLGEGTGFGGFSLGYRYTDFVLSISHESGQADIGSTQLGMTFKLF